MQREQSSVTFGSTENLGRINEGQHEASDFYSERLSTPRASSMASSDAFQKRIARMS